MSKESAVRAFAPATVANLGPGFDILGLALEGLGDTVRARLQEGAGVRIEGIEGDGGALPRDAALNTAGIAASATLRRAGVEAEVGVSLHLHKGLPIGSGLGSSAASAAAAALAVNVLIGSPLRKTDLIEPCLEAEAFISGGRHADNVAPALLGGLVMVRSVDRGEGGVDLVRLPVPAELCIVVVMPDHAVSTREARDALPAQIPLRAMVANAANLAAMISALYAGDLARLGRAMRDEVVTPARAGLIPGCEAVIDAALDCGALGSSISGAGPAIFALCRSRRSAREVGAAMQSAFERAGLRSKVIISAADCPGARKL